MNIIEVKDSIDELINTQGTLAKSELLKNIIKSLSDYYLIKNYGQAQDSSMNSIEELEKLKRLYKENLDKSIQSFIDFI